MRGWFLERLRATVPDVPAGRALVLVALIDSVGTGFFIAGSAVFLTRGLGFDATQAGAGIAIANLVGFALTVPLGMLSDRIGSRRMLAAMYAWHAVWMLVLPFATSFLVFVVAFTMVTVGDCGAIAVVRAVVSRAVGPEQRTRTLGYMRAWRNVGFTVGAALTAPLLVADTRVAYAAIVVANALAYGTAAVVVSRLALVAPDEAVERRGRRPIVPAALKDGPFLALTALSGLLALHVTMMSVGLPLWVSDHTDAPVWLISVLVMVNTVLAVALQVRVAGGGESVRAGRRALVLGALGQAAFCGLVAGTGALPATTAAVVLVLAVVTLTAGELWEAAGSWGLSYLYTPPDREGEYLAVFSLGATAEAIVGPLAVTGLVLANDATGWWAAGAVFLVAAASVRPVVSWLEATQRARARDGCAQEGAQSTVSIPGGP